MTSRPITTIARDLAAIGRRFAARGWVLGTGGNFSAVISRRPLRLAISASSVDKGTLRPAQILQVDAKGNRIGRGSGHPSAEMPIHLEIIRRTGAAAVLHTHSVWSTILSDRFVANGAMVIEGYEMLKALHNVTTHEHVERIPVLANDQNMKRMATAVGEAIVSTPRAHGVLLQRHGLYTWGNTLDDAIRHVETFEFLFEIVGRSESR